jgi:hypothetical protein
MRKIVWSLILISSGIIFSCSEDFLIKEPPGAAAGSVITSPDGIEAVLTGTYAAMRGKGMFGGAMVTDWTYGSIVSDDCYKGTSAGDATYFHMIERFECFPGISYLYERWRDCYEGVARANSTLDFLAVAQAGKTPLPPMRASRIEAEARFLRAWFHFQANKVFERIPYIKTKSELAPILPEQVPNSGPGWDGIEEDLQFAIDNLPGNFPGEPTEQINMLLTVNSRSVSKKFSKTAIDDIIMTAV